MLLWQRRMLHAPVSQWDGRAVIQTNTGAAWTGQRTGAEDTGWRTRPLCDGWRTRLRDVGWSTRAVHVRWRTGVLEDGRFGFGWLRQQQENLLQCLYLISTYFIDINHTVKNKETKTVRVSQAQTEQHSTSNNKVMDSIPREKMYTVFFSIWNVLTYIVKRFFISQLVFFRLAQVLYFFWELVDCRSHWFELMHSSF